MHKAKNLFHYWVIGFIMSIMVGIDSKTFRVVLWVG